MNPILIIAYDLKHQLDTNREADTNEVDGYETDMTARERIVAIIKYLEENQNV